MVGTENDGTKPTEPKRKTARRGYGEGSIFHRGHRKWTATITVGYNATGKRSRKTVYGKTKKEVTDKLTRLQNRVLDGTLTDSKRLTVGELLDTWLQDSARLSVSATTFNRYEGLVKKHIKPLIGGVKLAVVKPLHVQTLLSKLEEWQAGAETRRYAFQVLRRAFNVAIRWELLIRNPCSMVDSPKVIRRAIAPLSIVQVQKLLALTIGDIDPLTKDEEKSRPIRNHSVFVLAITTGLRQGELFALQWEDVDFENGHLSIRHTLEEVKGVLRLKAPKSKSGRRQVKLPAIAIESLEKQKASLVAEGLAAFTLVFPDIAGGFLRKSNFERRVWKPCRNAAAIPQTVVFHDLRHTSASILLSAGTHPKVVQERLGHSKIGVTMDTCSHLMAGMQDMAANDMDAALKVAKP